MGIFMDTGHRSPIVTGGKVVWNSILVSISQGKERSFLE